MKTLLILFISSLFFCNNIIAQVSHEAWDKLLKKHVTDDGVVDYEGFVKDKKQIDAYLESLNQNPPKMAGQLMRNWLSGSIPTMLPQ